MNNEEKARELSQKYGACFDDCCVDEVHDAAIEMAEWKDEENRKNFFRNNCSECKFFKTINKEPIYGYCNKNKWTFELWQVDARLTICSMFEKGE